MSEERFTNVSMGREEAYCDFSIIKVGDKIISEIPTNDAIRICDLLNEQQATISRLEEEKGNMNLFIKQTIQPLLFDCVFELCTIESMSQVELARKIEKEIIPFIQDFKYLKYGSLEEEKQDKS